MLDAYLAFWDLYVEVGGQPPPFDSESVALRLDDLTTGPATDQLLGFFRDNAATGLVVRGDLEHSPAVVANDGGRAVVEDCLDDRLGVYRVADDVRIDSEIPDRHLYTVSLRRSGGRWRVETVSKAAEPCTV